MANLLRKPATKQQYPNMQDPFFGRH